MGDRIPLRSALYLVDTAEALEKGARLVTRGRDSYDSDEMIRLAAERIVDHVTQTLLEAHRHDPDLRSRHPEVQWRQVQGTHVHVSKAYWTLDPEVVWSVLADELPRLASDLAEDLSEARRLVDESGMTHADVVVEKNAARASLRDGPEPT